MDKYGRSELNSIKNAIRSIIDILTLTPFSEEKESKDLDIFKGENNPSNIRYPWSPVIKVEDEMAAVDRLGGNYKLEDKGKTGVLIDYNLIQGIYFTRIEIIPRPGFSYKSKHLYIILEKDGKEIFRSEPGQLVMNFEKISADKFKLCFDNDADNGADTGFNHIKFSYVTRKPLDQNQINLKNLL